MFFLVRAIAVIAAIYHFSPVHEAGAPGPSGPSVLAEGRALDAGAFDMTAFDMTAFDMAALERHALAALDDPRYENWTAVPRHARDRLAIEIARQLAEAALAPPKPREEYAPPER